MVAVSPDRGFTRLTLTVLADGSRAHRCTVATTSTCASAAAGATVIGATEGSLNPDAPHRRHRGHQLGRRHRDEGRRDAPVGRGRPRRRASRPSGACNVSAYLTPAPATRRPGPAGARTTPTRARASPRCASSRSRRAPPTARSADATWTRFYTSPADAFPSVAPATGRADPDHARASTCPTRRPPPYAWSRWRTSAPGSAGLRRRAGRRPANNTDCKDGSDRGTIVHAAELQVFATAAPTLPRAAKPGTPGTPARRHRHRRPRTGTHGTDARHHGGTGAHRGQAAGSCRKRCRHGRTPAPQLRVATVASTGRADGRPGRWSSSSTVRRYRKVHRRPADAPGARDQAACCAGPPHGAGLLPAVRPGGVRALEVGSRMQRIVVSGRLRPRTPTGETHAASACARPRLVASVGAWLDASPSWTSPPSSTLAGTRPRPPSASPCPFVPRVFREGHDQLSAEVVLTDPSGTRRAPVRMTQRRRDARPLRGAGSPPTPRARGPSRSRPGPTRSPPGSTTRA